MIDLHLHLDGSLAKEDFIYLLNKEGVEIPPYLDELIHVPSDCPSLVDYLKRFDLPCSLMQSRENLIYVTKSLVNRLYKMGYIYAEIRFASQLHTNKGLTQKQVIEAVLEGLKEGLKDKKDFDANLILCMMTHAKEEVNMETLKSVVEINDPKIVAIDLAGAEGIYPSLHYKRLFDYAKEHHLNITIHAGEACGNESVMGAIDNGAMRIGHGVHLDLNSEESLRKVHDNHIYFEFCPTSNLQTKSLKDYNAVPLIEFRKHNIPVTINSDNMTVSNTDVISEFKHLFVTFNLSEDDVFYYLNNSIDATFVSSEKKEILRIILVERINDFYNKIRSAPY